MVDLLGPPARRPLLRQRRAARASNSTTSSASLVSLPLREAGIVDKQVPTKAAVGLAEAAAASPSEDFEASAESLQSHIPEVPECPAEDAGHPEEDAAPAGGD